jgi:hypothetical protein
VFLVIPGLLLVHLAIKYRVTRKSRIRWFDTVIITAPDWLWIYGNEEDGYWPQWWVDECHELHPDWTAYKIMYWWAAIRNSTNNVRFIKFLHPPPRTGGVGWLTIGKLTLVWQGLFSRIIWEDDKRWIAAGWKYEAEYDQSIALEGWQRYGCGFGVRRVTK